MEKVAIVTGSSSGIGFETALAVAREGYYTYATMRDTNKIISDKKRVDVLVNNAGYFLVGCLEDITMNEMKAQFETNFFGIVRTIQQVLPTMRSQKSGIIVNISSVAGRIGFPVTPAYISSKFALEGLSESMRYELAPFGIKTIIIEPGVVKTNLFSSLKKSTKPDSIYKDITEKVMQGLAMMCEMGTAAQEVARTIVTAIRSENPLPRYPVGNDAVMFLEAKKSKTDIEFENYIKKELYE